MEYRIKVCVYEIYQERVRDLLDPYGQNKGDLKVREDQARGFYVQNLSHRWVSEEEEIHEVLMQSFKNRQVGATNMNEKSSRSHLLFELTLTTTNNDDLSCVNGQLVMVDLAGSECVAKTGVIGKGLVEAASINKSLTQLGIVINALTDKSAQHIPYRDSQLTKLLRNGLGGNSLTTLIITCSPSLLNLSETISTLRFGTRAKSIKNKPKINKETTVQELRIALKKLEEQVAQRDQIIEQIRVAKPDQSKEIELDQRLQQLLAELSEKNYQISDLQETQQSKEDEVRELQEIVKQLQDEIASGAQATYQLNETIHSLKADLSQSENQRQIQQQELAANQSEIALLKLTCKRDQQQLSKMEAQLQQLQAQMQASDQQRQELVQTQQLDFDQNSMKIDMLNLKIDKLQDLNKHLRETVHSLQAETQRLQQERSSDIRSFQSLQSEEMVLKQANSHLDKSIAELSAIIANKDRQLIELNLQLQNRILKVVELEESIDEMKDQQQANMSFLHADSHDLYKELMAEKQKFAQLSQMYQTAISIQQQVLSHQTTSQRQLDQKIQKIQKLELQNFELRKQAKELKSQIEPLPHTEHSQIIATITREQFNGTTQMQQADQVELL